MAELYDHILSLECYAVRLALSLTGVACTRRTVAYRPAMTPACPEIVNLNPSGSLPVLVDGDTMLTSVPQILVHLARRSATAETWLPARHQDEIGDWLAFADGDLSTMSQARAARLFGAPGDAAALGRQARAALRRIEDHLTDRAVAGAGWLVGDAPTLADVAVFPSVALSHDCGIGHEDYPALNLWQRRMRHLPGHIGMPGIPDYF